MRQVRFDIVGGASCPTDCEEEGVGYASISDAECACGEQGCPISSGSADYNLKCNTAKRRETTR